MQADSGIKLATLKTDGGMVANELLMQFQADILDVPVVRPKVSETTALGAAYAAGLAVGYWHNTEDLRANWGVDKILTPAWRRKPARITTNPGRRRCSGRSPGSKKSKEGSGSFLKKRTKKLLLLGVVLVAWAGLKAPSQSNEVFLLLFVHKKKSYVTSCNKLACTPVSAAL